MVRPHSYLQRVGRRADVVVMDVLEVSFVMPAHNEADILADAVRAVVVGGRAAGWAFEVVVVENGSVDATAEIADRLCREHPEVSLLRCPDADYGAALRSGFEAAGGWAVVNFDVDYVDLGFAREALATLRAGADIVIGTKRGAGSADGRSLARRMATAGFVATLKLGFGLRASDTHGLKALRRDRVSPLVPAVRSAGDIFDTELVLRSERAGLGVAEIPVTVTERRPARTPIARRVPRTLRGLLRLRLVLWEEALGRAPARRTPQRSWGAYRPPSETTGFAACGPEWFATVDDVPAPSSVP